MSLTPKQSGRHAFYGTEALREYREQRGDAPQIDTATEASPATGVVPVEQPVTAVEATDSSVILPTGTGFAIVIPLRDSAWAAHAGWIALPRTSTDAVTVIPPSMPATLVQCLPDRVLIWYGLDGSPEGDAVISAGWRLHKLYSLNCLVESWAIPPQPDCTYPLPTDPTTVLMAHSSLHMYTLVEIEAKIDALGFVPTLEEEAQRAAELKKLTGPEWVVDPDAALPDDVLQRLLDHAPGRETWERRRSDLRDRNSAYDQEIVRLVTDLGYDEQAAVNAVIHHRRLHGHKPELREDYFKRLLSKESRGTAEPQTGTPEERPPRRGRRQISVAANHAEQAILEEQARLARHNVSNYFRTLAGLPPVYAGRPDPIQEAKREDWIHEKLKELGLDPTQYWED